MRVTFTVRPPAGERFGPSHWQDRIGTEIPLRYQGQELRLARLIAAGVAADGRSAQLTVETGE